MSEVLKKIQLTETLPETPFAPEWDCIVMENYITDIDFKKIAEIILSKEKQIIKDNPTTIPHDTDGGTGLGNNSLTSKYQAFNVFLWQDEEIQKLKIQLFNVYLKLLNLCNIPRSKTWMQCWANVLRDGEQIQTHAHSVNSYYYLGGHICVQCTDSSTVYINPKDNTDIKFSKNNVGKFTIFQNNIPHYTTKHIGNTERITIAFDLFINAGAAWRPNTILFDNPSE